MGFVAGKMADRKIAIARVDDCPILTRNTRAIVSAFEQFIRTFDSRLAPYDEFDHVGFWRMLTVRDFQHSMDCMVIVTVAPNPDVELVGKAKKALVDLFLSPNATAQGEFAFRVTSLHWSVLELASDEKVYELLAGAPYVYEGLLGGRFRVSPSTFFQTNTRGAEVEI